MVPIDPAPGQTIGARVIGGILRIGLAQSLFPLTGLITAGVLTRYLEPEGYGHFTLAAMLVVWLEITITSLLGNAAIHRVARADNPSEIIRAILRLHLWVGVLVAALLWALAPALSALWNEPQMTSTLRLFALDIPIVCVARGYGSVLAGQQAFSRQAAAIAGRYLARLVLTVALVAIGFSIVGAVCAALGASIVELWIAGRRRPLPALFRRPVVIKGLWAFAGPIFLSSLLLRFLNLDLFVLKALGATTAEAGFYGAAHNLALAPVLFVSGAASTLLAALTVGVQAGRMEEARRVTGVAMRLLLAALPVAALISGSAAEIVSLVYGSGFAAAGLPFSVLIFSSVGFVAAAVSAAPVIALGRPRLTLAPVLPVVPLAVLAYFWLVPRYGSTGAAGVTAVASLCAGAAGIAVSLSCWELRPPLLSVARSAVLSGALFWASRVWEAAGVSVIAEVAVLGLCVPLGFVLLGELSARDRADLLHLVRSRGLRDKE